MAYAVKEIFYSLQGEGAHAGRPAIFCRFSGCNLWSGKEQHRADAICQFCDTDFVGTDGDGGGSFADASQLAVRIKSFWPQNIADNTHPYVVCTGGEPLLQLDPPLIDALHAQGIEIAIETNGTLPVPDGIDWICVSPKAGAKLVVEAGDELKLVYPQDGHQPADFTACQFDHLFLQPLYDENQPQHVANTVDYCLKHPRWNLSLQTHKLLGLP
ncbi:MAG: 7-carboxy-7-deazaguanine synthase [Porticoccaceae bacterium]|nr:7-carboxy-7-deazaguanine synthase [Porticoccaceae bacterium]